MTERHNGNNRDLESAKLYHSNRAEEEASRAQAACCPGARSSHEGLSALHAEASNRLNEISTLRSEIHKRVG